MGDAIITFKVMPDSPETDMSELESVVKKMISDFCGETQIKAVIEPVAFGLKALKVTFVIDENKGSPDALEKSISDLDSVNSCDIIDVRRALG